MYGEKWHLQRNYLLTGVLRTRQAKGGSALAAKWSMLMAPSTLATSARRQSFGAHDSPHPSQEHHGIFKTWSTWSYKQHLGYRGTKITQADPRWPGGTKDHTPWQSKSGKLIHGYVYLRCHPDAYRSSIFLHPGYRHTLILQASILGRRRSIRQWWTFQATERCLRHCRLECVNHITNSS
jgi:hypothetical protein